MSTVRWNIIHLITKSRLSVGFNATSCIECRSTLCLGKSSPL